MLSKRGFINGPCHSWDTTRNNYASAEGQQKLEKVRPSTTVKPEGDHSWATRRNEYISAEGSIHKLRNVIIQKLETKIEILPQNFL